VPRIHTKEEIVPSINGMEKLDIYIQKNETTPYLLPYIKFNGKCT
jgi:hypothetical protein